MPGPILVLAALALHLLCVQAYDMVPRWGAAVAVLPQAPTVIIQGGKTDLTGQYSYNSAPNSPDTILLPLSSPFSTSNPPYSLLNPAIPGPSYAWHCLAPLYAQDGEWTLLSFGGDGGWPAPISDSQSAWLVSLNPTSGVLNYTHMPSGWGNQPSRRVRHACAAPLTGGKVYITGGQEADYSEVFAQTFVYDPARQEFTALAPLPIALYAHASVLLTNGTLLVFGGVSARNGVSALQPMNTIYSLDTTTHGGWISLTTPSGGPSVRQGATASLNTDGTVFVFGGTNGAGSVLNDGWVLDPRTLSWTQVFAGGSAVPGRYDQAGVPAGGGQVIVVGGYGASSPVAADTIIVNSRAGPISSSSGSTSGGRSGSGTTPGYAGHSSGSGNADPVGPAAPTDTSSNPGSGIGSDSGSGSDIDTTAGGDSSGAYNGSSGSVSGSSGSGTESNPDSSSGTLQEYTPAPLTNPNTNSDPNSGGPRPSSTSNSGSSGGTPITSDVVNPTLTAGTAPPIGTPTTTHTMTSSALGAQRGIAPLTLGLTVGLITGLLVLGAALLLLWWCLRRRREERDEEARNLLIRDDMEKGAWGERGYEPEAEGGPMTGGVTLFDPSSPTSPQPLSDSPPFTPTPATQPQRSKSLLVRISTKIWRRDPQPYTPIFSPSSDSREPTIRPASTRDHFTIVRNPLPFEDQYALPRPPKPYNPDDIVFGQERDMGVREVPGCIRNTSRGTRGIASVAASFSQRPKHPRQTTAEISKVTPFYGGTKRSQQEAYDPPFPVTARLPTPSACLPHAAAPQTTAEALAPKVYNYPALSVRGSLNSTVSGFTAASGHVADASFSTGTLAFPALGQIVPSNSLSKGRRVSTSSRQRKVGPITRPEPRPQNDPFGDPKSPPPPQSPPKINLGSGVEDVFGQPLYSPSQSHSHSGSRSYPSSSARVSSDLFPGAYNATRSSNPRPSTPPKSKWHDASAKDPFAEDEGEDDAPLLVPEKDFKDGFPFPAFASSPPRGDSPTLSATPAYGPTVPSTPPRGQQNSATRAEAGMKAEFEPRSPLGQPMPPPESPYQPLASRPTSQLVPETQQLSLAPQGDSHKSLGVNSMRSAASHSSIFAGLGDGADLDLSLGDFATPLALGASYSAPDSPTPMRHPHTPTGTPPSPFASPLSMMDALPHKAPGVVVGKPRLLSGAGELHSEHGHFAGYDDVEDSDEEEESLLGGDPLSGLGLFNSQGQMRNVSSGSNKALTPRSSNRAEEEVDEPPRVSAPLRVRSRSRPPSAECHPSAPTSPSQAPSAHPVARNVTVNKIKRVPPPPLGISELPAQSSSPDSSSSWATTSTFLLNHTVAPSSTLLYTSTRPKPPAPARAATTPLRPSPAHTAPTTPIRHPVRQGSLASFASTASLRPGQEGYVSMIASTINQHSTPESARTASLISTSTPSRRQGSGETHDSRSYYV